MGQPRKDRPHRTADYCHQLLHAIRKFLPQRGLPLQSPDSRLRWTDRLLVMTAMLMVWQPAQTARDAFEAAREVVVSMYRTRRRPGGSFRGFMKILVKATERLLPVVMPAVRRGIERVSGEAWRWGRWVVMAADGSRIDCPRTVANEEAFGCAGRAKTGPQLLLTVVFHVATGCVWAWRRGSGKASERAHLLEMVSTFPKHTLLLADAGYTGYDLLKALMEAGHDFVVRVGANVTLLRKLGYCVREYDGIVYLWPENKRGREPLVLRLVEVRGPKGQRVCLVSSVLEEWALPDREVGRLYRRRWLVEVAFRSLKQTMQRRKMFSQRPDHVRVELDWSVVGLGMLGLMAAGEVRRRDRGRCSTAKALRAVRGAMRRGASRPPSGGLRGRLREAVVDGYVRTGPKAARGWPHKKKDKPPGAPNIRMAKKCEVQRAQQLREAKQWR